MKVTNTAALADERWESEQISARKIQPQAGRQAGQKKPPTFQSATSSGGQFGGG